jgi:predicted ribosome quality control (RQC) complex YloA/Tae2 family protein
MRIQYSLSNADFRSVADLAELSGLEVCVLVKEINGRLRSAYVNNIYSLGEAQLFRLRRQPGDEGWLVASPRLGAWCTESVSERAETTGFTSSLRSELARLRLSGASQFGLDRVYDIAFGDGESVKRLVVEMAPPGNLIVLDGGGRVLLSLRRRAGGRSGASPGSVYVPPAQKKADPSGLTGEIVRGFLEAEPTVGKALGRRVALPRKYVAEIVHRLGLEEETGSSSVIGRAEEVAERVREMVTEVRERPSPCICETRWGEEIFAIEPRAFTVKRRGSSMSELCDYALAPRLLEEAEGGEKDSAERRREELRATIEGLLSRAEDLKKQADKMRLTAERAAAAATRQEALSAAEAVLDPELSSRASAASSAAAVASVIYDRVKELRSMWEEAYTHAKELERKLERIRPSPVKATTKLERKKREWFESFRWFVTSGGRLAVGGRDAQSNSVLIRRHLEARDTVFHADLFGSPFFVLKGGEEQTEQEVKEVAQATVAFSSAWKTGLAAADAYWVKPDQLGAAAPSGEYLPRGSFMIKGRKNFVPHNRVEVAVGLDGMERVVSGPESAIGASAYCYVVLVPHREKPSETAKKVMKELESLSGGTPRFTLDEVVRALPPGGGKIVRRRARQRDK